MLEEKIPIRQELNEIFASFQQKGAEERACIIIRNWFYLVEKKSAMGETVPEKLEQSFYRWLNNPVDQHIRDKALWSVLSRRMQLPDRAEIMNEIPPAGIYRKKKRNQTYFINVKN